MVAAAVIGGAVIGAAGSSMASRQASKAQSSSAEAANRTQAQQYEQTRQDTMPWREAGIGALGQLTEGTVPGGDFNRDFSMADFQSDPGYEFRRAEGQRGVEASAAARGGLLNGGTLRALTRYNQDAASGEYSNAYNRFNNDRTQRFNRLSGIAGTGQTATRDVANQGAYVAANMGNNMMQAANARASGYVGSANAVNSGMQSIGNFALNQNYMNRAFPQSQPASSGVGSPGNAGYGDYNEFYSNGGGAVST